MSELRTPQRVSSPSSRTTRWRRTAGLCRYCKPQTACCMDARASFPQTAVDSSPLASPRRSTPFEHPTLALAVADLGMPNALRPEQPLSLSFLSQTASLTACHGMGRPATAMSLRFCFIFGALFLNWVCVRVGKGPVVNGQPWLSKTDPLRGWATHHNLAVRRLAFGLPRHLISYQGGILGMRELDLAF